MSDKQKVFLMEGPDRVGKTNIGQGLSLKYGIPYFRMDTQHENWRRGKFKEALEFDQTYLVSFLRQVKCDVVIDRAYPSEWVYSRVYARDTNPYLLEEIDEAHAKLGTTIIVPLRHSFEGVQKDEVVEAKMLPIIQEEYLRFIEWTKCNVVSLYVDGYDCDLKRELEVIVPELEIYSQCRQPGFKVVLDRQTRKPSIGANR